LALRQPLDQITKLTRAMPFGKVFLGPPADRLRKRPAIGAQLRETPIDLLQMFFAKLGYFTARFATVILQIQDLFCFLERQAQRLRFLDESDTTNRFRRVKPIICLRTFRLWQQLKSLIIMERLQTDPGRLGSRANPQRFLTLRRFRDHHICLEDRVIAAPGHLKFHFAVSEKLC